MPILYLIPGLGADERMFRYFHVPGYEAIVLPRQIPEKGESLTSYAKRLLLHIDSDAEFVLLGVSLGGLIAVEVSRLCKPVCVILISSCKTYMEIPPYIRIFRYIPLYKLLPASRLKKLFFLLKPLFNFPAPELSKLLKNMLDNTPDLYIDWSMQAILKWENKRPPAQAYLHLHGTRDMLIPYICTKNANPIKGGTHAMILNKGQEISQKVIDYLGTKQHATPKEQTL